MLALAACDDDDDNVPCVYLGMTYALGDTLPHPDGCNYCTCTTEGIQCTEKACTDGGVDASWLSCLPSGGCPSGPACNFVCCDQGERCNNGTCVCGTGAACGSGDSCQAAGPVGTDACGSVCCGASGPCPQ